MEISAHHNLTAEELRVTIIALTKSAHLEAEVFESLEKALACDCPKAPRDPAVSHLMEHFTQLYADCRKDINGYVARILAGDLEDLVKGEPDSYLPTGPLTDRQVRAIQQAIRDRFGYVAASIDDGFTPDDLTLKRWKRLGIIGGNVTASSFSSAIPESAKLVRNAFIYGRFQLAIERGATSYEDILKVALEAPILGPDHFAISIAEKQAANYITQFGENLSTEVTGLALKRNRGIVHDMAVALQKKELQAIKLNDFAKDKAVTTWQEFKSELYHTMDDRARDWDRIGFYELYDAKRYGEGLGLLAKYGPDQMVYKTPLTTACPQCKALYLDQEGHPRLFKLEEMLAYGNNIGRKPMPVKGGAVTGEERPDGAEMYQAVAGLVHPWCECSGPFPFTGMEWWADQK